MYPAQMPPQPPWSMPVATYGPTHSYAYPADHQYLPNLPPPHIYHRESAPQPRTATPDGPSRVLPLPSRSSPLAHRLSSTRGERSLVWRSHHEALHEDGPHRLASPISPILGIDHKPRPGDDGSIPPISEIISHARSTPLQTPGSSSTTIAGKTDLGPECRGATRTVLTCSALNSTQSPSFDLSSFSLSQPASGHGSPSRPGPTPLRSRRSSLSLVASHGSGSSNSGGPSATSSFSTGHSIRASQTSLRTPLSSARSESPFGGHQLARLEIGPGDDGTPWLPAPTPSLAALAAGTAHRPSRLSTEFTSALRSSTHSPAPLPPLRHVGSPAF